MPSEARIFRAPVLSLGAGQHHTRAPSQGRLAARPMDQRLQSLLLFRPKSTAVWVARFASKPPIILDVSPAYFWDMRLVSSTKQSTSMG